MVHCFLTGVQMHMEQAFVLNRREARDLMAMLGDRLASLRRVVEQFAPLDDSDPALPAHHGQAKRLRKHHRLVCQAVADAIAPGFPEIELFQAWPAYQSEVQALVQRNLRAHPVHGQAIKKLDERALREGGRLGVQVLRLLDPQRKLRYGTRVAVCAAACTKLPGRAPEQVVRFILEAVAGSGDCEAVGLSSAELADVRRTLQAAMPVQAPAVFTATGAKP